MEQEFLKCRLLKLCDILWQRRHLTVAKKRFLRFYCQLFHSWKFSFERRLVRHVARQVFRHTSSETRRTFYLHNGLWPSLMCYAYIYLVLAHIDDELESPLGDVAAPMANSPPRRGYSLCDRRQENVTYVTFAFDGDVLRKTPSP